MQVLGVIPARGGSERDSEQEPLRSSRPSASRLHADAVKQSAQLTRTIVSTDDERGLRTQRIARARRAVLRPSSLALLTRHADASGVCSTRSDTLKSEGFTADDRRSCCNLRLAAAARRAPSDAAMSGLERAGGDSVVSVVEVPHQFSPVSVMRCDDGWLFPFLDGRSAVVRRQGQTAVLYARNGPAVPCGCEHR
jgi:CMP-N-acetylneuraminic acid synthetase